MDLLLHGSYIRSYRTTGTTVLLSSLISISKFFYSLAHQLCNFLLKFDWLVNLFKCSIVLTTFLYCHWGCTSFYQPLSYPFRSLEFKNATVFFQIYQRIITLSLASRGGLGMSGKQPKSTLKICIKLTCKEQPIAITNFREF